MQVAAGQTTAGDCISTNLKVAAEHIAVAKSHGAEMVALPECFALMAKHSAQLRDKAEVFGAGPIQDCVAELAVKHEIWIIAGSLPLKSDKPKSGQPNLAEPKRVFNSLLVYNSSGAVVARYDKMHLFDADLPDGERHRESDYTIPGDDFVVCESPAGKLGLSICYDVRFGELYRKLSTGGASIFIVPAAFAAATGRAHWQILLQARAIENACYVIAPAQVGKHPGGRTTHGHSMIIDPWGNIISHLASGPGVITADIDMQKLKTVRTRLPCHLHRRPQLFT